MLPYFLITSWMRYLMAIKIVDWENEISHGKTDAAVGIKIAALLESNKQGTYITIIPPNESVTPHYHQHGDETYHIISGEGVIRLQPIDTANKDFGLVCKKVKSKNSFLIPPNVIHQLINTGKEPLTLIFSCPLSHLKDDRSVVPITEK